ncbi:TPA: hypothetical protein ACP5XP_000260 [Vibrio parahaemolyticus]
MQITGYIQPISPLTYEPLTKSDFNKLLDSFPKSIFNYTLNKHVDTELHKVQKRKFASLTEFQKALIASSLRFEPLDIQNEFHPEELQLDLVSQLQQAEKAKRSYFQVHAFKLELSIFFHIYKGNLYIYDIADISKHGLKLISDVYNLKALDSITMRKQLHCAQFIEASKFDSKLNQLVKQIWKAGYKFFYFSLSKESMRNLESSLMKHSSYADTDPIIGICFEKTNESF